MVLNRRPLSKRLEFLLSQVKSVTKRPTPPACPSKSRATLHRNYNTAATPCSLQSSPWTCMKWKSRSQQASIWSCRSPLVTRSTKLKKRWRWTKKQSQRTSLPSRCPLSCQQTSGRRRRARWLCLSSYSLWATPKANSSDSTNSKFQMEKPTARTSLLTNLTNVLIRLGL